MNNFFIHFEHFEKDANKKHPVLELHEGLLAPYHISFWDIRGYIQFLIHFFLCMASYMIHQLWVSSERKEVYCVIVISDRCFINTSWFRQCLRDYIWWKQQIGNGSFAYYIHDWLGVNDRKRRWKWWSELHMHCRRNLKTTKF